MRFMALHTIVAVLCAETGADEPRKAGELTLVNQAKDIRVISDREEAILDYFRRQRIVVGGVAPESLDKVLAARKPLEKFFINYASHNDDPKQASLFGAVVEIAPPSAGVAKLLADHRKKERFTLILRRDDKQAGLYHVVGCTSRTSVGFFDNAKKNEADGFSQKDLCFKNAQKQEALKYDARYLRVTAKGTAFECGFILGVGNKGSMIQSVTGRGTTKMTVSATYNNSDVLVSAEVTLATPKETRTAKVEGLGDKVKVLRPGKDTLEFDVPAGVIVTSAPDWTDTFMLCKRYDRKRGGKQSFPGLWVHPEQTPQRPTFTVEAKGADKVTQDGKSVSLVRIVIELRPKNQYMAWVDAQGRMIKLTPLPFNEGGYSLVLEGFEKTAAALRP